MAPPSDDRPQPDRGPTDRIRERDATSIGESRPDAARDAVPTRLGRYVVVEEVGSGGMGRVLRAYDPKLHREVALKLLVADAGAAEATPRILREAQAMARLSHPNVVPVYDVDQDGTTLFIAMEYVEGETLRVWLSRARHPWREVLAAFVGAGRGLAAAHAAGVVHRDFKPDNAMVAGGRVRVMDFGLARGVVGDEHAAASASFAEAEVLSELTQAGTILGTAAYMAPEQHRGDASLPASDQFAFCVALYEGLCGVRPFVGADARELEKAKLRGPPPPTGAALDVPGWLHAAVVRGLAADPSARWPTMDALLDALERGQARARRRRFALAIGAVAMAMAAVVTLDARRREARCVDAGASIRLVWNDTARMRLRDALIAAAPQWGESTANKAMPWLDAQADAWESARTEICRESEVHARPDVDTTYRALWCLDERRMEFDALVEELSGVDATAVHKAVGAAAGLPRVEQCRDRALLARLPAPPVEQREQVRAVRAELATIDALERIASYDDALTRARAASAHADALGWSPLKAAAREQVAPLLDDTGDYVESARIGTEAYFEAAEVAAWDVAARAATRLSITVGYGLARHDEGLAWGRHAALALAHAGDGVGLREATRLGALGLVHARAGEDTEAQALHARALAIREEILGPDHPSVATSLNDLAISLSTPADSDRALELLERALAIREHVLGPEHPDVAQTLGNIANAQRRRGAYDVARGLHERALALRERVHGPTHPVVAASLNDLALCVGGLGDHQRAAQLLERALSIVEATVGPDSPNVATALNNLANVHAKRGETAVARTHSERALAIVERSLGPDHADLTISLVNLAELEHAAGNALAERALLERAMPIYDRQPGVQPGELDARFALAQVLLATGGDRARARTLAEQARDDWNAQQAGAENRGAEVDAWLASTAIVPPG